MPKLLEFFDDLPMKNDWRTQYIRYRLGRLKHQYWLWNRKRKDQPLVDEYDYFILKNCQPGHTVFFGSAGYYLKDIWNSITVVEQWPVVKTFYPDTIICSDRSQLPQHIMPADNFAVVNNRADHWVNIDGLTQHVTNYTKVMNPGCRFFYSFRDTQMHVNRLTVDLEKHFYNWALELEKICDLKLVWHSLEFPEQHRDQNSQFPMKENPDTTNGNLKFIFTYKGDPWTIQT